MIEAVEPLLSRWRDLVASHPWAAIGLTFLVFAFLAKVTEWILVGIALRWAKRSATDFDDRLIALIRRPVFASVIFGGCGVVARIAELSEDQHSLVINLLQTLLILVWAVFLLGFASLFLELLARNQERVPLVQPRTLPLFDNLAKVFILGAGTYLILVAWQLDIGGWLASAGIIGIAVGFAAKDTLANLFSGVFILADAPYQVGDYIVLDGTERGQVTQIGLRSTRLLTRDDVEITLPNAVIANAKIVNQSGGRWEKFRVRIPVGVAYGSDIDQVRSILLEIAEAEENFCADPGPRVRLRAFGASSLDFQLMGWIDEPALQGMVIDALLTAIYKRFLAEGIEIPYPKRDLYLKEAPRSSSPLSAGQED